MLPISLLWIAVDLYMRPTLDLRLTQWGWWALSIAFSLVMWHGLFALSRLLQPKSQAVFVAAVALTAARWPRT